MHLTEEETEAPEVRELAQSKVTWLASDRARGCPPNPEPMSSTTSKMPHPRAPHTQHPPSPLSVTPPWPRLPPCLGCGTPCHMCSCPPFKGRPERPFSHEQYSDFSQHFLLYVCSRILQAHKPWACLGDGDQLGAGSSKFIFESPWLNTLKLATNFGQVLTNVQMADVLPLSGDVFILTETKP